MKHYYFILLFSFSCLFFSCSNQLKEIKQPLKNNTDLATEYIDLKILEDKIISNRSITNQFDLYDYPSFMEELIISDNDNNIIKFSELSDEEKVLFFEGWKKVNIDYIEQTITNDKNLKDMLETEIEIINCTLSQERSTKNKHIDKSDYILRNFQIRQSFFTKKNRSTDNAGEIKKGRLVPSSYNILKNDYQKGRVFICTDNTSSASSLYAGHAAIMVEEKWKDSWNSDSYGKATVSAWPYKNVNWEGKINGAQYEPIGYWAGNYSGSATNVEVYQMQRTNWKWGLASLLTGLPLLVKSDAPEDEAEAATHYAKSLANENIAYGNHPYNIGTDIAVTISGLPLGSKWWDSTCYCSQLVWRSWCSANLAYDFSGTSQIILPISFALTTNTRQITTYSNK